MIGMLTVKMKIGQQVEGWGEGGGFFTSSCGYWVSLSVYDLEHVNMLMLLNFKYGLLAGWTDAVMIEFVDIL